MNSMILIRPALPADIRRITSFIARIDPVYVRRRELQELDRSVAFEQTFIAQLINANDPAIRLVGVVSNFLPGGEEPFTSRASADQESANLRESVRLRERMCMEHGMLLVDGRFASLGLGEHLGAVAIISAHVAADEKFDLFAVVHQSNPAPVSTLNRLGFGEWHAPSLPNGAPKPDRRYFRFGEREDGGDETPERLRPLAKNLLLGSVELVQLTQSLDGRSGRPTGNTYLLRFDSPLLDEPYLPLVREYAA